MVPNSHQSKGEFQKHVPWTGLDDAFNLSDYCFRPMGSIQCQLPYRSPKMITPVHITPVQATLVIKEHPDPTTLACCPPHRRPLEDSLLGRNQGEACNELQVRETWCSCLSTVTDLDIDIDDGRDIWLKTELCEFTSELCLHECMVHFVSNAGIEVVYLL